MVGGLEQLDYFPYIENNNPNWLILVGGLEHGFFSISHMG